MTQGSKDLLAKTLLILTGLFWPVGFLLDTNLSEFLWFFFPNIFLLIAFFFYSKGSKLWILFLVITLCWISFSSFGTDNFREKSVFYYSHDDEQNVLKEGYLYPSIWLSRMFQNKPAIYLDRIKHNFFVLVDPNNYFFGNHPRQIVVANQNLQKFPSLTVLFFLLGLFSVTKNNRRKLLIVSGASLLVVLSLMRNFDRFDLSLYLVLILILWEGVKKFFEIKKWYKWGFVGFFLIFTLIEYLHMFVNYFS